jgi:hypothetical protein
MDRDFGNWLAGFIDGEGCFCVRTTRVEGYVLDFSIRVRDDERSTLDTIVVETGIGRVRAGRGRRNLQGYISHPLAIWAVDTKADCRALANLLTVHPLRAKKRRDFVEWSTALTAWERVRRGGNGCDKPVNAELFSVMRRAKERMEMGRRYDG